MVADIIDVTRTLTTDPENRVPHLAFQPDELSDLSVVAMDDVETAYYLRMTAVDKPGVVAAVAGILGEAGISIEAMQQKQPLEDETEVPLVMLTHRVRERQMSAALAEIERLDAIRAGITRIRVESLG